MTFDTNGHTMMGLAPDAAVQFAHTLDAGLIAFGSNCGIGPAALVEHFEISHDDYYADSCHLCYETRRSLRDRLPEILTPDQVYGETDAP